MIYAAIAGWATAFISFTYFRSQYHRAKAEVYQEFADTFRRGAPVCRSPKDRRRKESKRHYMELALVDPLIRDGLADALEEAEETWKRRSVINDPPRDWRIERVAADG